MPKVKGKRQLNPAEQLMNKFRTRTARIAVIGIGYVGLPLAVSFAEAGFNVIGIDVNKKRVSGVNVAKTYIADIPSERLAAVVPGKLSATTDYNLLRDADAVIICVPTPLNKTKDPDISFIRMAAEEIAKRLHPGMLVVLESTSYPGTTEEILLPRFEQTGLVVGEDFFLAFSPERIDPGRGDWTVKNTPKVVGGVTKACTEVAKTLYSSTLDTLVPVSSPRTAEMVKLLENTFRAVNIALVNEMAIMCDHLDLDVWEVINAAKTKPFGFMPFYPGPGLGGHCIPIDPQYLSWKLKTLDYRARFIEVAEEINFGMPRYVLEKITNGLNSKRKPLKGSKVLVLGVAYKPNVGDTRDSPALEIIRLLDEKGVSVSYNDPHVPGPLPKLGLSSVELKDATLKGADCVVIVTDHGSYDWDRIVKNSKLVVDTRNATRGVADRSRVVLL